MSANFEILFLERVVVALALAALIGLERERQNISSGKKSFGGIRTFPLIGLLGALTSYLLDFSELMVAVLVAGFSVFMVVSYFLSSTMTKSVGLTSEIAAFLVFAIGFISAEGQFFLATALTLIVMLFLFMKNPLHLFAREVKQSEIVSTIKFMLIAFVILPLLPNEVYGPFDAFNPYIIWLMVVFISGISFVSYLAVKLMGAKRGIGLTGFFAGLVSSTALALSFSGESKTHKKIVNPYVFAILVASSAMFFRVLLEVSILNIQLLDKILYPMLVMGGVGLLSAGFFWFKGDTSSEGSLRREMINVKSPFQLKPALKFGLAFAAILFLSKASLEYWGEDGIYLTSFLSGLLDVDAITVSMAQLSSNGLDHYVAGFAITIAAITNTFVKFLIFLIFGNREVAMRILSVYLLMLVAGMLTLFLF